MPLTGLNRASRFANSNFYTFNGQEQLDFGYQNMGWRWMDNLTGRMSGIDPKDQFASGYVGLGNNPVMGTDPNGQFSIVGAIAGGATGYIIGKRNGLSGLSLVSSALISATIGAFIGDITGSIGSTVAGSILQSGGSIGKSVLAGSAAKVGSAAFISGVQSLFSGNSFKVGLGNALLGETIGIGLSATLSFAHFSNNSYFKYLGFRDVPTYFGGTFREVVIRPPWWFRWGKSFASGVSRAGLYLTLATQLQGDTNPKSSEEKSLTLYRGVHAGHPDYPNAIRGMAVPMGGHSDPILHNLGDNKSVFTSWTASRSVADFYANRKGIGGVVLTKEFKLRQIVPSPDKYNELEYLVPGVVRGARVTSPLGPGTSTAF